MTLLEMVRRSYFVGEFQANLVTRGFTETDICVTAPFGMIDWQGRFWGVPEKFVCDGASFPSWLKYIPALITAALWKLGCVGSITEAVLLVSILQSFVGAALLADYIEGATLHDVAYFEGVRPKLLCDLVFLVAMLKRIELLYRAKKIGLVRVAWRTVRSLAMFGGVVSGGWFAWYGHRWRQRRRGARN